MGCLGALAGIVPAFMGVWGTLLNSEAQHSVEISVAVAFVLFGCSLPLNLGNSVLIALNQNHISLLIQMVGSLLTLGFISISGAVHAPSMVFIASGFVSQCLVGLTCLLWAGRIIGLPLLGLVLGSLGPGRAVTRIWHLAGPMAVINASLAVAFSTDRLVLIHVADGWAARNVKQLNLRESEEMRMDREYLEQMCAMLESDGIETDCILAGGDPGKEIADAAEREQCDLIAMSTHGHRFIKDMIYGSVANEVRHLSRIPVLLVRGERRATPRESSPVVS